MTAPIDRRAFLSTAGAAGVTLLAGPEAASALRPVRPSCPGPRIPRKLQQAMRGHVFERGSPGFSAVYPVFNERFDYVVPRAVARPLDTRDVRGAVRWAVAHGVPLRARSGGHSYAGYSTLSGGVVLDLIRMNRVTVDRRAGIATIGAGARTINVYAALARQGATIPAGSCPTVGIGGVTLGGGMGLAGRAFGLTSDNLVGAEIVTPDGCVRQINQHTDPDLLWALRGGGGGNFGVVTQFRFRVHRLPRSAAYFFLSWPWSAASDVIAAWQAWAPHTSDKLTSILHLEAGLGTRVRVNGQYLGSSSDLGRLLAPLTNAVPPSTFRRSDYGYMDLQLLLAGCAHQSVQSCGDDRQIFRAKSDYVTRPVPAAGRRTMIQAMEARNTQSGSGALLFDAYGGAINRVAPHATAFVHRNALFCIQYLTYNGGAGWIGQTHAALRPFVSGMAYQNYIDGDLGSWRRAYYGSNYGRLLATRRRVDPHHFFNFPQAIGR